MNCVEYGEVPIKPKFPCKGKEVPIPTVPPVPPPVPPPGAPSEPEPPKVTRALNAPPNVSAVLAFSVVSPEIKQAIESVKYIAENMRTRNKAKEVEDDWKYVAMVIDRIFLWVFVTVCITGTLGLFLQPLISFFT